MLRGNGFCKNAPVLETAPQTPAFEQLSQQLEAAHLRIALLEKTVSEMERRRALLEAVVQFLKRKKYGPGAETLSEAQLNLLELEPGVCAAEVAAEAALDPADKVLGDLPQETPPAGGEVPRNGASTAKTRTKPVRAPLPPELERKERVIPVPAQECSCSQCGAAKKLIGYETSERLASMPVTFYVEVLKREKRACARCEEMGVSTAPVPAAIIEKGILADSLVVDTIIKKYRDHNPLYRQSVGVKRDANVEISQSTLSSCTLKAGELLLSVVAAMKAELLAGAYIQADETTVPVQSERTKGKNHQGYLWEYSRPGELVVYDFQMGRGREGPASFLEGFEGRLQSDGYPAYGKTGGPGLLHFGCWAHVRRKFFEASKLDPRDARSVAVVVAIGKLYEVERQAREAKLTALEREALRQRECPALLAAVKALVEEGAAVALPKSGLGRACGYALKQWERLECYAGAGHGMVEIDNNRAENAMRPIALGRKNWIQIGSEQAGPKIAAILSVLETCKRLGVQGRDYLLAVLPQLSYRATRPGLRDLTPIEELTPAGWQRAREGSGATLR